MKWDGLWRCQCWFEPTKLGSSPLLRKYRKSKLKMFSNMFIRNKMRPEKWKTEIFHPAFVFVSCKTLFSIDVNGGKSSRSCLHRSESKQVRTDLRRTRKESAEAVFSAEAIKPVLKAISASNKTSGLSPEKFFSLPANYLSAAGLISKPRNPKLSLRDENVMQSVNGAQLVTLINH